MSSRFGTVAALIGVGLLGERLTRVLVCGVVASVAGVAALSALTA